MAEQRNEQPGDQSSDSGAAGSLQDRLAERLFGPTEGGEDAGSAEDNRQVEGDGGEAAGAEAAGEQGGEAGDGEQQPTLVDVEINGKTYPVHPDLKSALMAHSDYTQKSQETAGLRRMLDLERVQMQHRAKFDQACAPELNSLQQLDWQLQAYRSLDWTAMDTDTANKTRIYVDQLKDQREELVKALSGKRQVFEQEMGTLMQTAIARGDEYLKRHIQGWGPATQKQIEAFGLSQGYSDIEMKMLTDARMKKTLWQAMQYVTSLQKKAAGQGRVPGKPPGVQPRAASSNQSAAQVRDLQYHKAMKNAKSSSEKQSLVQNRLADKLFGPAR